MQENMDIIYCLYVYCPEGKQEVLKAQLHLSIIIFKLILCYFVA